MTLDERRSAFKEQIAIFVGQQRLCETLKREELARLEGGQRHFALSKSRSLTRSGFVVATRAPTRGSGP